MMTQGIDGKQLVLKMQSRTFNKDFFPKRGLVIYDIISKKCLTKEGRVVLRSVYRLVAFRFVEPYSFWAQKYLRFY